MKKLSKKSKTKRKISKRKTLKSQYRHNGKIWDFIKRGGHKDPWARTITKEEQQRLLEQRTKDDEYYIQKQQRLSTNIQEYVLAMQKKFADLFTRFVGTVNQTLDELIRSGDPYSIQKNNESLMAAYKMIDELDKQLQSRITAPKGLA